MTSINLDGKVALVTGGSRGIGAAIAKRLAAEGATVALTYVNSADKAEQVVREIEKAGGRAAAIRADNREAEAIEQAVRKTVETFGKLDILVNSAGIWHAAPLGETSVADFDEVMAVNLRAPFVAVRAAAGHLGEGGRIISIGSNLAELVPWPGISLYSASKAALIGLTKGLARDLGPRGITVNVVHPGSTNTDMNPAGGDHSEPQRERIATGSFGEPEDIAGLVAWLAGPEGKFVSGASLTIDGGANA
ncbi:3-oxoacyl-ACP reductase family protein [Rhizobium sp. LC145]|uniref:SDR family NAD(P)-dependent oxidoreductase n=1 Tax=Rhizobium sp. LC145 TaxID=1120688 RepID=UPI00062A4D1E|nr:3-oxoacyl-ACP reductase family protein [Rhizobium sp. LC145]KKX31944.1 oxidoreductase [Rhizobium sp. LC145]TKT59023.1 3-oxoacyl-ACP reductase FabG [Rhizobiaceae bacterium LC148]